jgi:hypothetical protein
LPALEPTEPREHRAGVIARGRDCLGDVGGKRCEDVDQGFVDQPQLEQCASTRGGRVKKDVETSRRG